MSIPLNIAPKILRSISSLYNDINRIFMEYIDNSLDNAERLYDEGSNSYKCPIEIVVSIEGIQHKYGAVKIMDNCLGIENFQKVVQNIGYSDKKAQPWTNGQFGYGIYSFMAGCSKMDIWTKIVNKDCLYLPINRDKFEAKRQEDVEFPDFEISDNIVYDSGTIIKLSYFDKYMWKQIDLELLKSEIEKHFEMLLKRENLTIVLKNTSGKEYICEPFDYNKYEGESYEDTIYKLHATKGKKKKQEFDIYLGKPIKIYIKITKGVTINKNPVFIAKGRRIAEIKDIKQFKSEHKSDLWAHPNVTGYVDVTDVLEPTIARTDFRNTSKSKALFHTLIEIEPLILDVVKDVNKTLDDRHYKALENRLNKALSKLARFDAIRYRTEYLTGKDENLLSGSEGRSIEEGMGEKDNAIKEKSNSEEGIGGEEGDGVGLGDNPGPFPGDTDGGGRPKNQKAEEFADESEHKGRKKKKSGYNIRIVDSEPDIEEETNKQLRSKLASNEIQIFRRHPDFVERVAETRKKEKKITQRLITYLAGEITVHYKDHFYRKEGQPEYNISMFKGVVEFIYQLEAMLSDLADKNLAEID